MRELTTERLLIRPWQATYRDYVYDMYSRWEVQRFLGRDLKVMARREAAGRVETWLRNRSGCRGARPRVRRRASSGGGCYLPR